MICSDCAWEADSVKIGRYTHDEIEFGEVDPGRMGHAWCIENNGTGCDCQHHRIGE